MESFKQSMIDIWVEEMTAERTTYNCKQSQVDLWVKEQLNRQEVQNVQNVELMTA